MLLHNSFVNVGSKQDERIYPACWQNDAFYLVVNSNEQLEFIAWLKESCKKLPECKKVIHLPFFEDSAYWELTLCPQAFLMYLWPSYVRKCGLAFLSCCIWLDTSYFYSYDAGKSRDVKNLYKGEKTAWGQEIIEVVRKAQGVRVQSTYQCAEPSSVLIQTTIILTKQCISYAYKARAQQESIDFSHPNLKQCLHSPGHPPNIFSINLLRLLSSGEQIVTGWRLKSIVFCGLHFSKH